MRCHTPRPRSRPRRQEAARGSVTIRTDRGVIAGLGSIVSLTTIPGNITANYGFDVYRCISTLHFVCGCMFPRNKITVQNELIRSNRKGKGKGKKKLKNRIRDKGNGSTQLRRNPSNEKTTIKSRCAKAPTPHCLLPPSVRRVSEEAGQHVGTNTIDFDEGNELLTSRSVHACLHCRLRKDCRSERERPR